MASRYFLSHEMQNAKEINSPFSVKWWLACIPVALEVLFTTEQVIISIKKLPSLQLSQKAEEGQPWNSVVHVEHWFMLALRDSSNNIRSSIFLNELKPRQTTQGLLLI